MGSEKNKSILTKLTGIPVQVIYMLVILSVALPLISPIGMPIPYSKMTLSAYDLVESFPAGSAAVFDYSISPGNYAECSPGAIAVSIHMLRRGMKVVYVSTSQDGPMFVIRDVTPAAQSIGKKYGEDFVLIGFLPGIDTGISSLLRDMQSLAPNDYYGNRIDSLPMMKTIKSGKDVSLVLYTGGGGDQQLAWIRQAVTVYGCKYLDIPNSVLTPNAVPFYPNQIHGIVNSIRGGAEYELLIKRAGIGVAQMDAVSVSHLLVIALVIVGNIGYVGIQRMRKRK